MECRRPTKPIDNLSKNQQSTIARRTLLPQLCTIPFSAWITSVYRLGGPSWPPLCPSRASPNLHALCQSSWSGFEVTTTRLWLTVRLRPMRKVSRAWHVRKWHRDGWTSRLSWALMALCYQRRELLLRLEPRYWQLMWDRSAFLQKLLSRYSVLLSSLSMPTLA